MSLCLLVPSQQDVIFCAKINRNHWNCIKDRENALVTIRENLFIRELKNQNTINRLFRDHIEDEIDRGKVLEHVPRLRRLGNHPNPVPGWNQNSIHWSNSFRAVILCHSSWRQHLISLRISPQFGILQIRGRIQKLTLKMRTARRLRCPTVSSEEKRANLIKGLSEALNRLVEVRSCPSRFISSVFFVPGNCISYKNAFLVF